MPSPMSRASHGWFHHTATSGPVSSNTRPSTFLSRRLRVGRTWIDAHRHGHGGLLPLPERGDRAHVAAVAVAVREVLDQVGARGDAQVRERLGRLLAARLDRLGERARPGYRADVGGPRFRGRQLTRARERPHSAASSHHQAGWPPSCSSSSTPSGTARSIASPSSGRVLPHDAGDQLGAVGHSGQRLLQRLLGVAPRHQLVAPVADGVADREAALGVLAGGLGHAAEHQRAGGVGHGTRVVLGALAGVEGQQRGQSLLRAPWSAPPARAARTARRRARRPGSRWGCWAGRSSRPPPAAWTPASSS